MSDLWLSKEYRERLLLEEEERARLIKVVISIAEKLKELEDRDREYLEYLKLNN